MTEGWQVRCGHLHILDLFEIQRLLKQCEAFEAEGDTSEQGGRWERVQDDTGQHQAYCASTGL